MPKKLLQNNLNLLLMSTTILAFFFFLWGINSWKFSFVGDEWFFYLFAKNLVEQHPNINPFSFSGVYGTHSPMVSMYQAFFMQLFGVTNFSWRLSNIILIFPISYFFYKWIKLTFNKEVAVFATILIQSSFFLANFFKIGYDNPQAFTLFIICLYLASLFGAQPTKKTGFWLGITLGIAFYNYFGAAFPLFIWPYFLPLRKQLGKPEIKMSLLKLIGVYLLLLFPLIFQISSLHRVMSALGSPESFHANATIYYDFLLFYKNHDYFYNHFINGPYLDGLSQIFCLIGTVIVLLEIKQKSYRFLLLSYLSAVIFIGSTSPDWFSPTTRGMFLIPYGMAFAGLGLDLLRRSIKDKKIAIAFCAVMLSIIVILNVYQSQIGTFVGTNSDYSGMSLIVRSLQQEQSTYKHTVIILSPSLNINTYTWQLPAIAQAYGIAKNSYTIIPPDKISCMNFHDSTILTLQQDTIALQKLTSITCNPSRTYTILNPTIMYF